MAVINIAFDTVAKTMSVTKDGDEIPNVVGASVGRSYCDDDCWRCEIVMHERDDEQKTDMWYRLTASEAVSPGQKVPGFATTESRKASGEADELAKEVAAYFAGRKR